NGPTEAPVPTRTRSRALVVAREVSLHRLPTRGRPREAPFAGLSSPSGSPVGDRGEDRGTASVLRRAAGSRSRGKPTLSIATCGSSRERAPIPHPRRAVRVAAPADGGDPRHVRGVAVRPIARRPGDERAKPGGRRPSEGAPASGAGRFVPRGSTSARNDAINRRQQRETVGRETSRSPLRVTSPELIS